MKYYPIFASVVICIKNQSIDVKATLEQVTKLMSELVSDYELVIVDNASDDNSVEVLQKLTGSNGLPNLQIYALTKEVDTDTAAWIGLENALGDFVFVFNPLTDDLSVLPTMLDKAVSGSDVVFATNLIQPKQSFVYRLASSVFNQLYKWFSGVNLTKEAPSYRVLSKRIINFILQHPQPSISYRHLPATAGFIKSNITYSTSPKIEQNKKLGENIERGIQIMVSTTRIPMRLVTFLSLFGAGSNLIYSLYVVLVGLFVEDVAPGWVSMSLQMSGMFFLISLVLLVLGEYILHVTRLTNGGPLYHIGQEFTSTKITRLEKLNLEEGVSKPVTDVDTYS